jgi:hypothetical protein
VKNSLGSIAAAIRSIPIHLGGRFGVRALFIGGVALLFATQSLLASGTVKGRVFDRETKDPLPGANVTVKGTSIGTATDLYGAYTLPNVPPGTYSIQVSYIGYLSRSSVVSVSNDSTTKHSRRENQSQGQRAVAHVHQRSLQSGTIRCANHPLPRLGICPSDVEHTLPFCGCNRQKNLHV